MHSCRLSGLRGAVWKSLEVFVKNIEPVSYYKGDQAK